MVDEEITELEETMDYLLEDHDVQVGTEVTAYCSKCKADTLHTVQSTFEDEIRTVSCLSCQSNHAFKVPRGEPDDDIPEPMAVRRRQEAKKPTWQEATDGADAGRAVAYSPAGVFEVGTLLQHAKFGLGYVAELLGQNKMEVLFADATRILVHGRSDLGPRATGGRPPAPDPRSGGEDRSPKPAAPSTARKRKSRATSQPAGGSSAGPRRAGRESRSRGH